MRKPFLKQLAASYLAAKQERSDAEDSAAEVAVAPAVEVAARQPVKRAKAGERVPSPAEAPLQQPGAQVQQQTVVVDLASGSEDGMSSIPASQAALQEDGISARSERVLWIVSSRHGTLPEKYTACRICTVLQHA